MPKAIPEGLTAQHVLLALQDLDEGIENSFGPPTGYELVHDDKRHPPKAVVGIAFRHLTGSILPHGEFSGGESAGQANFVLRNLGFSHVIPRYAGDMGKPDGGIRHCVSGKGHYDSKE